MGSHEWHLTSLTTRCNVSFQHSTTIHAIYDNIRNEHVKGSVKVAPVTTKITVQWLKWNGHVKGRDEWHLLRRMLDAPVP